MIHVTCRINFIEPSSHKNYYSVDLYSFFDKKNRFNSPFFSEKKTEKTIFIFEKDIFIRIILKSGLKKLIFREFSFTKSIIGITMPL